MTDRETHPYAVELAKRISERPSRRISIKFRTMLNGFGFYRRTDAIIPRLHDYLNGTGLTGDFSTDAPRNLDDRIAVRAREQAVTLATKATDGEAAPKKTDIDAIANALDATVEVLTESGNGSGFIVHPDGLVVTARHVVDDDGVATRVVKIRLHSGQPNQRDAEGVVFRSHRKLDFALVWILGDGPFPVLPIGDPQALRHAQTVFAIGSPAGMARTVSRGIVSNPCAQYNRVQCIQTDAAIDHGNSGGPLITEQGAVVGINLWGIAQYDAAKFVVPIDYLTTEIARALQNGRKGCLDAASCPVCGFADFTSPIWFCRNCGIQMENNSREAQNDSKERSQ